MTLHDDTPTAFHRPIAAETIGEAEPASDSAVSSSRVPRGRGSFLRRRSVRKVRTLPAGPVDEGGPAAAGVVPPSRRVRITRRLRPRRPSRWFVAWTVVALLLAGVAGFVAWLGIGLLGASRDIKASADAGQAQLTQFKNAATSGDRALAESYLAAADANLAHARKRSRDPQIRVAARLPILSTPVADLRHLLSAATTIAAAGHTGLDVYGQLSGGSSTIYNNGRFDIPALRSLTVSATAIDAQMGAAEAELAQVDGTGLKEDGVLAARDSALTQVRSLRKQMTDALPVLEVLPDAVGASGPKTYLVAVMNPAELRASGGAPLSVAELQFTDGQLTRGQSGTTSELTAGPDGVPNLPVAWSAVKGDPFRLDTKNQPGKAPFVNAGFNPDFRVAGANMAAAWQAQFARPVDGVIALDTKAIEAVLAASGPIPTAGYGTVDATNMQKLLLEDAYKPELAGTRHTLNYELMGAFIERLQTGGSLVANAKGLAAAAPARHLQLWFPDKTLAELVAQKHYDGAVATPETGDHIAVYTQNGNLSKTDVFQQRSVTDAVTLAADGSAKVTRTVTIQNTFAVTDAAVQVSRNNDYLTGWMRPGVISLLPQGAVVTKEPVSTFKGSLKGVDQAGRPFYKSNMEMAPGTTGTWVLEFTVPRMAVVSGSSMTLDVLAEPQAMATIQQVHVEVTPPAGWTATAANGDGASVVGGLAVMDTPVDRVRAATFRLQGGS